MAGHNQGQSSKRVDHLQHRTPFVWSDATLRLIFENSPDAILLIDNGLIFDCNQAAIEMLRYGRREALLSLPTSELSPDLQPDGRSSSAKLVEVIATAFQKGSQRFEWTARRSDNTQFPAEVLLTAIPFEERHILHAVFRDITRRKAAELELSKSREKEDAFRAGQGRVLEMIARGETIENVLANLVTLIEAQSEGMLCSVLQLSEDGKHIRHGAAPSLPEIYVQAVNGAPIGPKNGSCGTAMFLGKPVIVTDMLIDPLWEDYRELARLSGLRACWSTPIFSGSGKVLGSFAMYYRQPQAPSGTESRLTEVATHIAGIAIERKRAEEQLRTTQTELAHVARVTTMGELAASIAHEVNQPLGAIVGNADICLSWLDAGNADLAQLREAIEDISSDGHRASQVISRIRSLVKKQAPEKVTLDLSEVAQEVLDLVGHEAQRKQVTLTTQLGNELPRVEADRVQLQQVLLNLVMNGIEAMNNLDGRKPILTLTTDRFGEGVITTVSDCGSGFEPTTAEQLFKPFHTTKTGGMGMGLAISRSIIESHGGKLWAEANHDFGASFKFTLPASGEGRK
jgi:two-component system, cell cycle sensor histidine kinase and response regulator CckA